MLTYLRDFHCFKLRVNGSSESFFLLNEVQEALCSVYSSWKMSHLSSLATFINSSPPPKKKDLVTVSNICDTDNRALFLQSYL